MKLSVIIANHNQGDLLKLALNSLIKAGKAIDYELIVVDNASGDQSIEMLAAEYQTTKVIANTVNYGIAKAHNQGVAVANGAYVLLVNADTICGSETLDRALEFMDSHTDVSGLGVRMLGAQGSFLRESNRD
ncbi:glycosyltransferase family 2 protein [Mucilaginibacter antarcticus]|uniref:glycosyltransferase family 2 protein n=1 Tax=Mucilaginibacter antarcticus TaxID=1855725 RepID=UPI00362B2A4F